MNMKILERNTSWFNIRDCYFSTLNRLFSFFYYLFIYSGFPSFHTRTNTGSHAWRNRRHAKAERITCPNLQVHYYITFGLCDANELVYVKWWCGQLELLLENRQLFYEVINQSIKLDLLHPENKKVQSRTSPSCYFLPPEKRIKFVCINLRTEVFLFSKGSNHLPSREPYIHLFSTSI